MRLRLPAVLLLTALAFGIRGTDIYLRYLSTELSSAPPFSTKVIRGEVVVTGANPHADCYRGWTGPGRPQPGDRILAVYDHHGRGGPVRGLFDYGLYLKPINVEEPWTLVVARTEAGRPRQLSLAMPPSVPIVWGPTEWLANLGTDFYVPFLAIATGCLIGVMRWRDNQAWLASLLFLTLSLVMVPSLHQFPPVWRVVALLLEVSASSLLPYLVFRFFLRFPARSPVDRALPWLNAFFASAAAVTWLSRMGYEFTRHFSLATTARIDGVLEGIGLPPARVGLIFSVCAGLMLVSALVSVVLNAHLARTRDERRRLRIVAAGAVAGLLPTVLLFAAATYEAKAPLGLLIIAIPLVGLFPLSFAYVVVRHRVFGMRLILRSGITYALVSRGFLLAEGGIIFLALLGIVGTVLQWVEPQPGVVASTAGTAVATFMLTLGMRRVNRRVLPVIDRRFFRDAYDGRRILNDLSRAVRRMASHPEALLSHVTREVMTAIHPRRLAIFVRPDACDRLVPVDASPRGCCDLIDASGVPQRFALYVEDPPPGQGTISSGPSVTALIPGRATLSSHLAASASAEPDTLEVLLLEDGREHGERPGTAGVQPACNDEGELLARFETRLVVPLVTAGRVLGVLLLGEKRSEEPYSREDKELLLAVAGQVAIALDYSQLIGQAADQAALRREVQIAQEVQQQLFPHERPPLRSLRYAGVCRAARGVGGDFYDFLPLTSDTLGIALADIAGKGLPAALLMASLQALIRSHAPTHLSALEDLARELNRHLVESTDLGRYATLFFGVYDDRARVLRYVNAGHLPPMVVGRDESGEVCVRRLETGGMVLGLFPDQDYDKGCAALRCGDRLLVFSDGVTEASAPSGEMFGEHRLLSAVLAHAAPGPEERPDGLLSEVSRFVGPSAQQDDITVIAAEVR